MLFQINAQDLVLPARLVEFLIFFLISLILLKQWRKMPKENQWISKKLLTISIFCWTIYIFLDILVNHFAAASFDLSQPMVAIGFDIHYPSLFIANILRKIIDIVLFTHIFIFFIIQIILFDGEHQAKKILKNPVIIGVFSIMLIIVMISDNVSVTITPQYIIASTEGWIFIKDLLWIVPIFVYTLSAIRIQYLIHKNISKKEPKIIRKKFHLLSYGFSAMSLSYIWFLFWKIMSYYLPIASNISIYLMVNYVLHMFWLLSGILIFRSIQLNTDNIKKNDVANEKINES